MIKEKFQKLDKEVVLDMLTESMLNQVAVFSNGADTLLVAGNRFYSENVYVILHSVFIEVFEYADIQDKLYQGDFSFVKFVDIKDLEIRF